jgi:hypothetical protein
MYIMQVCIVAVVITVGAASDSHAQRRTVDPPAQHPAAAFEQFEKKLIGLSEYTMTFSVGSEGALDSKFEGTVRVRGPVIDMTAEGHYGPERIRLRLNADRATVAGSAGTRSFEIDAPQDFYESFVHAMTRAGLLYNLLRIAGGEPPDFPDEDADGSEWTSLSYVSTGERRFVGNIEAFPFALRYRVRESDLGEARVWINVASGLPFRREGTMQLREGRVAVIEHYGYSR